MTKSGKGNSDFEPVKNVCERQQPIFKGLLLLDKDSIYQWLVI